MSGRRFLVMMPMAPAEAGRSRSHRFEWCGYPILGAA